MYVLSCWEFIWRSIGFCIYFVNEFVNSLLKNLSDCYLVILWLKLLIVENVF